MNSAPKVTIVIPVFNGENFLREAIDSALAQTYQNIEIVVVNDGSRDDGATERIALSYGDKIRYFSQENGGVAAALNTAIRNMTGEYFSWLSHDDLYFPNKIQAQIDQKLSMDRDVILYSDFGIFYDDPTNLIVYNVSGIAPKDFRYAITTVSPVNGCTLLIPKKAFEDCGVFDVELRYTQDYDLWFRFATKYEFVHQALISVKSRSHPGQDTVKMKENALTESNALVERFARALTSEELTRNTGQRPPVAYAIISAGFAFRGFHEAAAEVGGWARGSLKTASWLDRSKIHWHLWRAARFVPAYRLLRGQLTLIRAHIRKRIKR